MRSFRVYFDGQERDLFRTYTGTLGITRHWGDSTSVSLLGSAFNTNEQEKYDIQRQYWLTQTETSENLGVGTYFQHARNYLKAHVESIKLMFKHKSRQHNVEAGFTYKIEHVEEQSAEYEMRDSAGYNIPHTGRDLNMIYSMRSNNELNANRSEFYIQDTWRFRSGAEDAEKQTLYTLNYGIRFSHWNFNQESILSPRVSLSIIPAFNQDLSFRFATGLYYQAPFYKELRDTTTRNGVTYVTLNQHIKSQRSLQFIAGMDYRFNIQKRPFKFTTEIYYKKLGNLIPYSVNNVKVTYYGDNLASGHSAGIDMKLYGEFVPGTDSWITLSLMDTKMKLNGRSIPMPTDQRYALNFFYTDYFPGTDRWLMNLKLAFADGLPFSAPHREMELNSFRAPAYKRADIGMSYRLFNNEDHHSKSIFKNVWLGVDCLNLFGISNVNVLVWPKVNPRFDQNRVEKPIFNIRSTHEFIVLCYNDKPNTHFGNTIDGKPMESIVAGYGTTSSAKDEICELLGDRKCFSTPKPVALVREMIRVASKKNSIILDFFAGSGTAGHATMALNKEDGGNRRFILVTNNESDICRKVTVPRLKVAIEREDLDSGFVFMTMLD